MKKIFGTLTFLAAFTIAAKAQNSIQLNYGFRSPSGTEISKAFKNSDGGGVTFLHQADGSAWSFGGTWTSQRFSADSNYFGNAYNRRMDIDALMFSLRKDIRFKSGHSVYWGVDLGVAYYSQRQSDDMQNFDMQNIGLATGFVLGTDWKIDRRFSIDVHGSYHYTYTDDIRYADKFTASSFKYFGMNLGVRYRFGKNFK